MFAADSLRYITPPPSSEDNDKLDANKSAATMQTRADGKENIPPSDLTTTRPSHFPPSPSYHDYNEYAQEASDRCTTGCPAGEAVTLAASRHNNNYDGGGQQYGYGSPGLSWPLHGVDWSLWQQQQQQPPAFTPVPAAVTNSAYSGSWQAYGYSPYSYGDGHGHKNLYAPLLCQPAPFGYSSLPADSTLPPASNHFNADAQIFKSLQVKSVEVTTPERLQRINKSARYSSEASSNPANLSKQAKRNKLSKKQKAAARIARESDFTTPEHLERLNQLSAAVDRSNGVQARASPVYELGAQFSAHTAPKELHQSLLPSSFQLGQTQKGELEADGVSQSTKRYENAPRVHMMERPSPSPLYTQLASQPPQLLPAPRPLLVVLDLNGTLLKRSKFSGNNNFTPRPYVKEFLTYLFANHSVMIWSSARPQNVATMCSDLFTPQQYKQLIAVWGRDRLGLSPEAYNSKVQVYKQLSSVWNSSPIQAANPNKECMWTQANTVLIDDSIEKSASEPYNLVEVEEFRNQPEQVRSDDYLMAVTTYLTVLSYQANVSAYIRSHPFRHESGAKAISSQPEKPIKTKPSKTKSSKMKTFDLNPGVEEFVSTRSEHAVGTFGGNYIKFDF